MHLEMRWTRTFRMESRTRNLVKQIMTLTREIDEKIVVDVMIRMMLIREIDERIVADATIQWKGSVRKNAGGTTQGIVTVVERGNGEEDPLVLEGGLLAPRGEEGARHLRDVEGIETVTAIAIATEITGIEIATEAETVIEEGGHAMRTTLEGGKRERKKSANGKKRRKENKRKRINGIKRK
mmetsp:Transcript_14599/g.20274  ORF Transcript_14599/g.20274 Transcript_14599/m.20274 type:complete len:182 (+) Transcript_14599:197-742(+)